MYSQIKAFISNRVGIPEQDMQKAFAYAELRQYKKGDFILKIGDYCRFIGFINYGLIVGTIIDESGKEMACNFTFENCFFTYTEGISSNRPSHKNFVVLEDCEMLILEKEKLPAIFAINQKFETLFTQILAEEVTRLLIADHNNRTLSAEERYLNFIETCPQGSNRIPLKHIAGYLGIEPPSLSRLRKKLAGK
jgi:CRP/FNR family transcriptional regulator, anaerobic regulatory protein